MTFTIRENSTPQEIAGACQAVLIVVGGRPSAWRMIPCVFEVTSEQLETVRDGLLGYGTRTEVLVPWRED